MAPRTKKPTPAELEAKMKKEFLDSIKPDLIRLKGQAVKCLREACDPKKLRTLTRTTREEFATGEVKTTTITFEIPPSIGAAKALARIVDEIHNAYF